MPVRPTRRATSAIAARFVLPLAFLPLLARSADDPRAWLERMSYAVEYLNYEGTLVHVHEGDSSLLKIVHRVDDGHVTERITSEDAGREIIRTDDEVTCIFPDQRTVLVEQRDERDRSQSPLKTRLPSASNLDDNLYHVAFSGAERIAGRPTQAIAIRPKDAFRYGYRIWLDKKTAMPLKTQLVDEQGQLLEQLFFSEVALSNHIPDSAVRPSVPIESFSVRRSPEPERARASAAAEAWAVAELPPGFRLAVEQAKVAPDARPELRHLVYSDGLATVSLFIEPAVAASEQAEGLSQIGAANAYTTTVGGHMITAMGEVPVRTVELFARSAHPVAGVATH
jgi:sigma-E factor negative regulatory protein RseB